MKQEVAELFRIHIEDLERSTAAALARCGYDALLVFAGEPPFTFRDDQTYPFRINPGFKHWVPLADAAGSFLCFTPGHRPRLVFHKPGDFWHRAAALPAEPWVDAFDVVEVPARDLVRAALPASLARVAFVGEPFPELVSWGIGSINPEHLLHRLDFARGCKSRYEIEALREANRIAVGGHLAARAAFRDGAAEYDIHMAFLRACRQREQELPYNAIVALNEHGATLHHQTLDRDPPATVDSLLIDAGATWRGYGSDITRTWVRDGADPEFAELVTGMDALQRGLCDEVRAGRPWPELHQLAVQRIARLLCESRIISSSADAAVASGASRLFFPHGLGHLLGLQVHDVGGVLADPDGAELPRPALDPALRLTRELAPGMVVTMEPGLYFVPALLEPARSGPVGRSIDWQRVARLSHFGGIRIEDDLAVTETGCENLTRPAFAAAGG